MRQVEESFSDTFLYTKVKQSGFTEFTGFNENVKKVVKAEQVKGRARSVKS